ncbi:MAG: GAF domain-containing protein [Campylobacterales bacterium]|nr:GAF domain-containing protein [Campylobacterales bacterium]
MNKDQQQLQHFKLKYDEFLKITIALTQEKNLRKLLHDIVLFGRNFTNADAGTLYIYKEKNNQQLLRFEIVQNDSLQFNNFTSTTTDSWYDIVINEKHKSLIAVNCAINKQIINIPNINENKEYEFAGTKNFDEKYNYKTQSLLVVPIINPDDNTLLGVLQLINKMQNNQVVSFGAEDLTLIQSLSSLSAAVLTRLKGELAHLKALNKELEISKKQLIELSNENLEYASMMQKTLYPTSLQFQKCFDDYCIINKHSNIVSPFIYGLKEILEDQFILFFVDSKQLDIKSVFCSMVVDGIVKDIITTLQSSQIRNLEVAWIYDFFAQQIDLKLNIKNHNNYSLGLLLYDFKTNHISFESESLQLHYNYENQLKIFDTKEQILKIKDDISLYLCSNNTLCKSLVLNSTITQQKNLIEKQLEQTQDQGFFLALQINNKIKTVLEYSGVFTQKLLVQFSDAIEEKIENIGVISNILTLLSEQFQNVMNYSKSENPQENTITSIGYICVQESVSQYKITTKNIISNFDKEKIETKLLEIQTLDREGIRKRYKELRKSGAHTHDKGGGIGFYEIAKRTNDIKYKFHKLNDDRYEFVLKTQLLK